MTIKDCRLRLVKPDQPPSAEYPHRPWACDLKPALCEACLVEVCSRPPDPRAWPSPTQPPEAA